MRAGLNGYINVHPCTHARHGHVWPSASPPDGVISCVAIKHTTPRVFVPARHGTYPQTFSKKVSRHDFSKNLSRIWV